MESTTVIMALWFVALRSVLAALPTTQTEFYVAIDGSDENPGTLQKPFATLRRAQESVRQQIAGRLQGNVGVFIRSGVYELTEALIFGPEDSGTEDHGVLYAAYPGETVVVSGGRRMGGWEKGPAGIWMTEVPGVKEGQWDFRQFYVNGRRATRARTPNQDDDPPYWRLVDARLPSSLEYFYLTFGPGKLQHWWNLSDVEVVVKGDWAISRQCLKDVDEDTGVATLAPPYVVRRSPYAHGAPNNGIFLDEGSKGFLIERNVIYNTAGAAIRHNQNSPDWHTWVDNQGFENRADEKAVEEAAAQVGLERPYRGKWQTSP
jgi:hypothetical protein